ncbi:MAG: hypothetical protein AAGB26_15625, partial [Planctomycetota bacterium]
VNPLAAEDQELPTTKALEKVFVSAIAAEDPVAFAQCWISAIDMVELMDSMAKIEPRIAEEAVGLDQVIEQFKERNERINKLYHGIRNEIQKNNLNTNGLSVSFGETKKQEMGKLVRYETKQIFDVRSEDGWVLKIEIDDILSFGSDFKFFDSPMHAVLTLADGKQVEVYNSGQRGIEWFDKDQEDG